MAGFILKNTLSENGAVTRGICELNEQGKLKTVHETSNIVKSEKGAAVAQGENMMEINPESYASMNMWGLTPEFIDLLVKKAFRNFFDQMGEKDVLKEEYLLPIYIDQLLQKKEISVEVLESHDKWFGVTYQEDKEVVKQSFEKLVKDGIYQRELFADLSDEK